MSGQQESCRGGGGGSATTRGIEFQKSVGTLIAAWFMSGRAIDQRLGLGPDAKVVSFAMEQQDLPVDDILIATSNGGYVAVQAKIGLSLSKTQGSRFHDTIAQFVKHWRACARGGGKRGWDRPLDPATDRLVVAVDPTSKSTVRQVLPKALRHLCNPVGTSLTVAEQTALAKFRSCVETAWADAAGEPPDPGFAAKLAQLVTVFEHDPSDRDRIELILDHASMEASGASSMLTATEAVVGEMMGSRGSVDLAGLRSRLMSKGAALAPRPGFAKDLSALRRHSLTTARHLQRYERTVLLPAPDASMPRECQPSIDRAALGGSLLVVGEAGIGKSAVLSALARNLRDDGMDVVQLAVDRHSVRTVEGLGQELGLEHDLVEVLAAWDGAESGWLLIDGLDAARGGETERAFRVLIKRTLELKGRWRVVASIRTFDLQMGEELRRLFEGDARDDALRDRKLTGIRHVSVPAWTDAEFAGLCERSPLLRSALASAPKGLRELARVPFNTNLIGELLNDGVDAVRLGKVTSQAQLLRLYWDRRIVSLGTPAQSCIFRTVEEMVRRRALRAAKHKVDVPQPQVFDDLSSVGVLTAGSDDAWVQFRHHVLFDFAAARWLLTHDTLGAQPHLLKTSANGLLLAPAMRFALNELWGRDSTRTLFWTEVEPMLTDELLDPVIRATAARMAAELPSRHEDLARFMNQVGGGGGDAEAAPLRVASALGIAMEDDPGVSIAPWAAMLARLAPRVSQLANVFRVLLHKLVERGGDAQQRKEVGIAARALLQYALSRAETSFLSRQAIGFVTTTYDTDPDASRQLLRAVFDESRFELFGHDEVPAVCDGAKGIMASDPEFVAEIYRLTYGREISEDRETSMSSSQIMSFRSTARQDYGMAHYSLEELFGEFLAAHPKQAVEAVNGAVQGYVSTNHPIPESAPTYDFVACGRNVRLIEDRSSLWAYDPQESFGESAPALVVKLLETLKSCDEELAIEIADALAESVSLGVFWSRAFGAAAARGDGMVDFLLPYAIRGPFLLAFDTRKDAIDVVAAGYDRLPVEDREAFERRVLSMDFARFSDRASQARHECLEALFGAIGRDGLVTDSARQFLADEDGVPRKGRPNLRPIRFVDGGWGAADDSGKPAGTEGADETDGARAEAAIRAAEEAMGLGGPDRQRPFSGTFDKACALLEGVERTIRGGVGDELVERGEGAIGQGCLAICEDGLLPSSQDGPQVERYLRLFRVARCSRWPEVQKDTEARFEKTPFWEVPAPRVEAARAMTHALSAGPKWHTQISHDCRQLLSDSHPGVRMLAIVGVCSLWDSNPAWFGECLSDRIRSEENAQVLLCISKQVLNWIASEDPALAESLTLELLESQKGEGRRQPDLEASLAGILATLWVRHQRKASLVAIQRWIGDCAVHQRKLGGVLQTVSGGYAHGLPGDSSSGATDLRHRCHDLALRIAKAAAADFPLRAARAQSDESEADLARQSAKLLDEVCHGIRFTVVKGQDDERKPPDAVLATLLGEASPTLECLADAGTPHTIYSLLETLEHLLPLDPGKVFDIAMRAVLGGGKRNGFQYESMGADKLVKVVGRLLADHRQVFGDEVRRQRLVQCLETFASVGWPSASRLLYRLPEVFR